ncbi:hypothetical protein M422DRAFT_57228, partial [Sphaerobolus stellatus SS14]
PRYPAPLEPNENVNIDEAMSYVSHHYADALSQKQGKSSSKLPKTKEVPFPYPSSQLKADSQSTISDDEDPNAKEITPHTLKIFCNPVNVMFLHSRKERHLACLPSRYGDPEKGHDPFHRPNVRSKLGWEIQVSHDEMETLTFNIKNIDTSHKKNSQKKVEFEL